MASAEFFPQCLDFKLMRGASRAHLTTTFAHLGRAGRLGVDELKVDRMPITFADELSAVRTSRFALQRWEELICAAFTKSVPYQIVNIINNKKELS